LELSFVHVLRQTIEASSNVARDIRNDYALGEGEKSKTLAKYNPTELTKEHQVYTLEGQKTIS